MDLNLKDLKLWIIFYYKNKTKKKTHVYYNNQNHILLGVESLNTPKNLIFENIIPNKSNVGNERIT